MYPWAAPRFPKIFIYISIPHDPVNLFVGLAPETDQLLSLIRCVCVWIRALSTSAQTQLLHKHFKPVEESPKLSELPLCERVRTGQRSRPCFSTLFPLSFACQQSRNFKLNSSLHMFVYVCLRFVLTLWFCWNVISPWFAAAIAVLWLQDGVR